MPLNALVYCRVSTKEQVSNLSLATQLDACRDYCRRNGLQVMEVFEERGESAKTADRTQLHRLLRVCADRKAEVDYVVVYKVDRFSRNVGDYHMLRGGLRTLGIELRSATEHLEDDAPGRFLEGMLALVAQFDNDVRSERALNGMKAAVARGRWPHQPPVGYTKPRTGAGASLVADSDRAPLVRLAFEMYATGHRSQAAVRRHVNALGLTTRRGNAVSAQTFRNMLGNPIYKGRIVEPRWAIDVEGDFDPLVDEALWDAVQHVLTRKGPKSPPHLLDHPDFPLRRFVRCAHHDLPVTGSFSRGRNGRFGYYRCRRSGCVSLPKERMEEAFVELLCRASPRVEYVRLFREVILDVWRTRRQDAGAAEAALHKRLQDLERRRGQVVDAYLDRVISEEACRAKQAELDADIAAVRIELHQAQDDQLDVDALLGFAERLLSKPAALWTDLHPKARIHLQRLVFPTGLTHDGESFGTAETSVVFDILGAGAPEVSKMVGDTGFEPVTSTV